MNKSEKRFEHDTESFLISPDGGDTRFNGQNEDRNWGHNCQHDMVLSVDGIPVIALELQKQLK